LWLSVDPQMILNKTKIDMFFLDKIKKIVDFEIKIEETCKNIKNDPSVLSAELLYDAKKMGFSDSYIAELVGLSEADIRKKRRDYGIHPVYKMIDTCAGEFESYVPYFYSTYEEENESLPSDNKKMIVLGSGPIRIGQGVEFDYSTVHAVKTIHEMGYEAIVINNNPETVSTDYTTADKLYFEPLTPEDILNVIDLENPVGVITSLGGQTAINLTNALKENGVKIIGTSDEAIFKAEDRDAFEVVLEELDIPHPKGIAVTDISDGIRAAEEIGYPVLVRPSFVLGGRAMEIVANSESLSTYLKNAVEVDASHPVLVDRYIVGKEVEVDAVCDGSDVFLPGIMELVERTGVHSGDSISVYPPFSISDKVKDTIWEYTKKLGIGIGIKGLYNIQFIVDKDDNVYIIEVNPRASRSVPFLSKVTGIPLVDTATRVMLGESLKDQGFADVRLAEKDFWYVKAPAFSFEKLNGMDAYLSPEMKSTGEAIGYDKSLKRALYKALQASGVRMKEYGTVMVTLADEDKEEALPLIRRFYELGFNIEATIGTGKFLKEHGIRTRIRGKISEGSDEILRSIRAGYVSYIINTRAVLSGVHYNDGVEIRKCAIMNGVTMFTSLDTVKILLDVLEDISPRISVIN
ncbi:MAG: carbamoyl-phosphate synthase large subunit, partial [Lachnospiraceae bacterium]|nr:carbamoyl-phosphate synthase large subunit [Lachnospiraceae bacterium]